MNAAPMQTRNTTRIERLVRTAPTALGLAAMVALASACGLATTEAVPSPAPSAVGTAASDTNVGPTTTGPASTESLSAAPVTTATTAPAAGLVPPPTTEPATADSLVAAPTTMTTEVLVTAVFDPDESTEPNESTETISDETERIVENDRFGFRHGVPDGFEPVLVDPTNGDGSEWNNLQSEVTLRIYGTHGSGLGEPTARRVGEMAMFEYRDGDYWPATTAAWFVEDLYESDNGVIRTEYLDTGTHQVVVQLDGPLDAVDALFDEVWSGLTVLDPNADPAKADTPVVTESDATAAVALTDQVRFVVPAGFLSAGAGDGLATYGTADGSASFTIFSEPDDVADLPERTGQITMLDDSGLPAGSSADYWRMSGPLDDGRYSDGVRIIGPCSIDVAFFTVAQTAAEAETVADSILGGLQLIEAKVC